MALPAISVQRRRGRARWRGSTASGDAWLVKEEEGGRGGASWHVGKAWSGRWPRWQRARRRWRSVAACERDKGRERRSGHARGGRGGCVASPASPQHRRKQEVARARASARRPRASRPSGERLVVTGSGGGLGQLLGRPAAVLGRTGKPGNLQVSFCSFIVFCFLFFI